MTKKPIRHFAEITVSYRRRKRFDSMPQVHSSEDANELLRKIWSKRMEHVEETYMLLLNRANRVLGYTQISQGGVHGTVVDIKVVFQTALMGNASGIIIAHNHPSGNLEPSLADKVLTRNLREAGEIITIQLLDHLILTKEGYYSMADEGHL